MDVVTYCSVCYEEDITCLTCNDCNNKVCANCLVQYLKNDNSSDDFTTVKCINLRCNNKHTLYALSKVYNSYEWGLIMEVLSCSFKRKIETEVVNSLPVSTEIDPVTTLYNNWVDIFTPKCPACNQGFDEFDGCFSITCSRCSNHFCGWCLQFNSPISDDTHLHCARCPSKAILTNDTSYYGTKEQFQWLFAYRAMHKLHDLIDAGNETHIQVLNRLVDVMKAHSIMFIDDTLELVAAKPAQRQAPIQPPPPRQRIRIDLDNLQPPNVRDTHPNFRQLIFGDKMIAIDHITRVLIRYKWLLFREVVDVEFFENNHLYREFVIDDIAKNVLVGRGRVRKCSCCHMIARHDRRTCPIPREVEAIYQREREAYLQDIINID